MSANFRDSAAQCSAVAGQVLGWSPAEFWAATPHELALALQPLTDFSRAAGPSREQVYQMMERDSDG